MIRVRFAKCRAEATVDGRLRCRVRWIPPGPHFEGRHRAEPHQLPHRLQRHPGAADLLDPRTEVLEDHHVGTNSLHLGQQLCAVAGLAPHLHTRLLPEQQAQRKD